MRIKYLFLPLRIRDRWWLVGCLNLSIRIRRYLIQHKVRVCSWTFSLILSWKGRWTIQSNKISLNLQWRIDRHLPFISKKLSRLSCPSKSTLLWWALQSARNPSILLISALIVYLELTIHPKWNSKSQINRVRQIARYRYPNRLILSLHFGFVWAPLSNAIWNHSAL